MEKNTSNIRERVNKGLAIVSKIIDVLKSISFGWKYFQIATSLREAYLINGMLTSSEIWYGMQSSEEAELEIIDKILLRRILEAPDSVCIESLYLELGLIPVPVILKARRINYLHYLANLKKDEMLYKVFMAQWNYLVKDDWTIKVKQNLEEFGLSLSLEEIRSKSAKSFKRMVKNRAKEYTLNFLLDKKDSHKKLDGLNYSDIKLQTYFKDPDISVAEAKNLYRFRTRSAKFKENMRSGYQNKDCPLCFIHPDTQVHSMQCIEVKSKITIRGKYEDIFKEKIKKEISETLMKITELRKDII